MTLYSQARATSRQVEIRSDVEANLELAMDRLASDVRTVGFGVPDGTRMGGSGRWTPALYHAGPTSLGFRADVDAGNAVVTCTPTSSSSNCTPDRLYLDRIRYFDELGCTSPDGSGALGLVLALDDADWLPISCTAVDASRSRLTIGNVPNGVFEAARSSVSSIEHVALRFVAGSAPGFGRLERAVIFGNTPVDTYPPTGASWETVASGLTDVLFEYRDGAGAVLTGSPLTAADRALVRSVTIVVEGFGRDGADGRAHVSTRRGRVGFRNVR